ncbi:MAG TPA: DUF190 domain-containing protein [Candidatus Dormibacteraeota bacterium]|nr:DUF190 domain-containing protein [Candidatus Dormibacteraeota bacterium]
MSAARLVRIYLTESERHGAEPLYQAIVERLRRDGFAGCVVFKGIDGFGPRSGRLTARIFELSQNLPILIEIVEAEERVAALFEVLDELLTEGLVTSERIEMFARRA